MKRYLQFLLAALVISGACDDGIEMKTSSAPQDYLPLRKDLYQIYDITSIRYELGIPETLAYELKTVVVDSFLNATGNYSYAIHRSSRNKGATEWTYQDTWSASTDAREAIIQEQNIPYLKFKTPIADELAWNGNIYNDGEEDTYNLQDLHATAVFGPMTFDDCITVNQNDNNDHVVFLDQRKELYGRNVGMIYKETTQLHYCTQESSGCLGQEVIEEGLIYRQTIKAYGVE